MRLITIASTAALTMSLAACATIMHGTGQDIGFSSNPSHARVLVDGQPKGETPVVVKLARKDNHIVRMELEGYQPFEATLTRSTSGWVWGNLAFGGIVGLAVDAISGGLYKINENSVIGQMQAANAAVQQQGTPKKGEDQIFIQIGMGHDPKWERIGTLTRN